MDRKEILKQKLREKFHKETNEIWGDFFVKNNLDFEFEITKPQRTPARVIYPNSKHLPQAISRMMLRFPKNEKIKVQAGEDLFGLDEKIIDKVIRHEAIHLGHPKHDDNFRRVANEVGTGISMSQILGKGFQVQVKEGNRYKTTKVFPTYDEALIFGKEFAKLNKLNVRILE